MENSIGKNKKVLAIDDDPITHKLLARALQKNYVVELASSSEEAIPIIFSSPPDAITLDLRMPGLEGHDFLLTLKVWQPQIPVLVLSATTEQKIKDECMKKGAFSYTEKPFQKSVLLEQIENALSGESLTGDIHIPDQMQLLELELVMKLLQKKGLMSEKEALQEIKRIRRRNS